MLGDHASNDWFGIDHVQLAIPPGAEDQCRAFYGDALGFVETSKPPELAKRGGVWFLAHGIELHLGVEADFRPARKAHPAFIARDVDAVAARLTASGYNVEWDTNIPGRRRFFTADPLGNRLEIMAPA